MFHQPKGAGWFSRAYHMEVHNRGDVWFNIKYLILQTRKYKATAAMYWISTMISRVFFFSLFKHSVGLCLGETVPTSSLYKRDTMPGHMKSLLWCKACFCCCRLYNPIKLLYHGRLRFLCCGYYSFCYDKVPDGSKFIVAQSLRVQLGHGRESVAEDYGAAGHITSTFRKQRDTNAGVLFRVSFLFTPECRSTQWVIFQPQWIPSQTYPEVYFLCDPRFYQVHNQSKPSQLKAIEFVLHASEYWDI